MAALLVAMSIMAVMLTVAMPVWKHTAQREKEDELVFRGMQYVHAIGMFQRKYANAYPPNLDLLVDQRFLRKKYKDPITNDDFQIIPAGTSLPGGGQPTGQGQRGGSTPGTSAAPGGRAATTLQTGANAPQTGFRGTSPIGTQGGGTGMQTTAGISGVTSKSKAQSIRLYNGRNHYNEWAFVYTPQLQAGQGGVPGSAVPGQRGQPGQRGGPGTVPGVNGPGGFGPGGRPTFPGQGGFGPPRPGSLNPGGSNNPNNPNGGAPTAPGTGPARPIFAPPPTQPPGRGRL